MGGGMGFLFMFIPIAILVLAIVGFYKWIKWLVKTQSWVGLAGVLGTISLGPAGAALAKNIPETSSILAILSLVFLFAAVLGTSHALGRTGMHWAYCFLLFIPVVDLILVWKWCNKYLRQIGEMKPKEPDEPVIDVPARDIETPEDRMRRDTKVVTLYQQGRYSEAAKVAKEALTVAEKTFGLNHPYVAIWLNNLGLIYQSQGRYAEAEPLYKRSLEIREKALGKDHPDVATTCANMAELYKKMGKEDEAEKLEARARKIRSNQ